MVYECWLVALLTSVSAKGRGSCKKRLLEAQHVKSTKEHFTVTRNEALRFNITLHNAAIHEQHHDITCNQTTQP